MTSESQIQANRKNAAKSTGPKTDSGKTASARNATRHGLSSSVLAVLPTENQADLDALTQALTAEHKPHGDTETFLVEQMIQARWKLARIQRLEAEAFDEMLENKWGYACPDRRLLALLGQNSNILDKLQRYATAAERCYYKALHELQSLRSRKKQNEAKSAQIWLKEQLATTPLPRDLLFGESGPDSIAPPSQLVPRL